MLSAIMTLRRITGFRLVAIALSAVLFVARSRLADAATTPPPWLFAGGDVSDSHAMLSPRAGNPGQLSKTSTPHLALKWTYPTAGNVFAIPTVEEGGLYVPDSFGWLYKLNPATGALLWKHRLGDFTGNTSSTTRSSPAIGAKGEILVGDQAKADIVAINRASGVLLWKTTVETDKHALIVGSPIVYEGLVYVGVGSDEEGIGQTIPGYQPVFRGSIVALDEKTGAIVWKFYTVPSGYAGAAVWASSPVVFTADHALIVATGNNYAVPASVAACVGVAGNDKSAQLACMDPANLVDAIVSLDLKTGKPKWSRRLQGADTWNYSCTGKDVGCELPAGSDSDFASMPNLVMNSAFVGTPDDRGGVSQKYVLGAGQKSGVYWRINPFNGGLFGSTFVGSGDIRFGSAVDTLNKSKVFVAVADDSHLTNVLAGQNGVKVTWNAGAWGAVDLTTGNILWQIPANGQDLFKPGYGGAAGAALAYSNHVVFAGSSSGYMSALDADTGKLLWTYGSGQPVYNGPAIFNDTVYWGTYRAHGSAASPMVYAFAVK
jgi:polyvinyl alcohol dehydrogenase (cytochrome)